MGSRGDCRQHGDHGPGARDSRALPYALLPGQEVENFPHFLRTLPIAIQAPAILHRATKRLIAS
jgi:hypothetical protein